MEREKMIPEKIKLSPEEAKQFDMFYKGMMEYNTNNANFLADDTAILKKNLEMLGMLQSGKLDLDPQVMKETEMELKAIQTYLMDTQSDLGAELSSIS